MHWLSAQRKGTRRSEQSLALPSSFRSIYQISTSRISNISFDMWDDVNLGVDTHVELKSSLSPHRLVRSRFSPFYPLYPCPEISIRDLATVSLWDDDIVINPLSVLVSYLAASFDHMRTISWRLCSLFGSRGSILRWYTEMITNITVPADVPEPCFDVSSETPFKSCRQWLEMLYWSAELPSMSK